MKYKHIFGPVPSRRLGVSLGIDLVVHKICSLDCVYCECGKTTKLTDKRKEYVKASKVFAELDDYLKNNPAPDYITFSGSGEPTLNSSLGKVIDYIKKNAPQIKVAVLTNSTLFHDPVVRSELLKADLVVPSLDAVADEAFKRINRPLKGVDVSRIIKGIKAFAKEYKGNIWLEVLILPGINDEVSDLMLLKEAIKEIRPQMVQLNTLDRPGTCIDINPASKEQLEQVKKILDYPSTRIIAKVDKQINANVQPRDLASAVIETIHRRPCTKKDLLQILNIPEVHLENCIRQLKKEKKIIEKSRDRGLFYETIKESNI